jgi:hypothetical protein
LFQQAEITGAAFNKFNAVMKGIAIIFFPSGHVMKIEDGRKIIADGRQHLQ